MRPHLRKAAIVAAVIFGLAALAGVRIPGESRLLQELENAAHAPVFGVVALVLLGVVRRGSASAPRDSAAAFGWAVLLGAGVEALQWAEGGDVEVLDIVRDAAGAASFLLAARALRPGATGRAFLLSLSAAALASVFATPALTATALVHRWLAFPRIASFESSIETRLCAAAGRGLEVVPSAGGHEARVRFVPRLYSGWAIQGPFPSWQGYTDLTFTVRSELPETIALNLRIHDARHDNDYRDRFNAVIRIEPGTRKVRIPLLAVENAPQGRRMDLAAVRAIGMFVGRAPEAFVLYFDDFRLEQGPGDDAVPAMAGRAQGCRRRPFGAASRRERAAANRPIQR